MIDGSVFVRVLFFLRPPNVGFVDSPLIVVV